MDSPASSPSASSARPTFACIRCSERKVRCDKQSPCNSCVRHNVECIFRPPKLLRKRQECAIDKRILSRLKRYETILREKGIDPNKISNIPEEEQEHESSHAEVAHTPWTLSPEAKVFKPKLLHGQNGTELVDNSLWSRVAEEIHDTEDPLVEESVNEASDEKLPHDDYAYVLGWKMPNTSSSHPPSKVIRKLWQTFIENVNPLTKLVHVPSLQLAIDKAVIDIKLMPRGFEALMFAIYSMAVLSLTEDECNEVLGESRAILLPRYVSATKQALLRAEFMSSTSTVVLQAFILHILSIRDAYEPRAVWNLIGIAIRIAEGMGMHFDGTLLGLSPFEAEIRRRIWWQLRLYDFRAAELCGQAKFRDLDHEETRPKMPANIDDRDLYPEMMQPAAESTKLTEMVWCMLRFALSNFALTKKTRMQTLGKNVFANAEYQAMDMDSSKMRDVFIQQFEDKIESKYLRFCDPSQPLQFMALLTGRSTTNMILFMAHHPRRWANLDQVPESEKQLVWDIVINLLEQYNMMQSTPQLRRFSWNVPYSIQWHVVIHMLDTLRANPLHPDAAKAWRLIDTLYENNLGILLSPQKPIFVAVGKLCLKAFAASAAGPTELRRVGSDVPEYIIKLREQLEATEAKSTAPRGAQSRSNLGDSPQAKLVHGRIRPKDDTFWLNNLDSDFSTSQATDRMGIDTDEHINQDHWLYTPDGEVFDWAQLELWPGDIDRVYPDPDLGISDVLRER